MEAHFSPAYIQSLLQKLKSAKIYTDLQAAAQDEISKPTVRVSELKKEVQKGLSSTGWERKLRNVIYQYLQTHPPTFHPTSTPAEHLKEPLLYLRKAQQAWEKRILKSLNSMCTELNIPLARKRPEKEQKELLSRWTELGTDGPVFAELCKKFEEQIKMFEKERPQGHGTGVPIADKPSGEVTPRLILSNKPSGLGTVSVKASGTKGSAKEGVKASSGAKEEDLSQIRPVYAPKDFLEVIMCLQNPNYNAGDSSGTYTLWGLVQLPLKLQDINKLRLLYSEMAINLCQTGVDDSGDIPPEMFDSDRVKLGKKVIAADQGPLAQEYSKKGCPISLRADLWAQILGVVLDEFDTLYYEQLKASVIAHDLLVDSLLYKDVKLTATNDDQYFVFEDYLYQILLPFTRDTQVLKHFTRNSASPPKSYIRGKLGDENFAVVYPPNGVIPFHGFAMYVAPLCYLYKEPVKLYYVFREIYMRYFFRLHSISSHPQGIVCLSLLFETLLQTHEAELFFHLKSVGCQPLKIAFKWLVRAFSGYLSSDQVLLLWDRILAYNSLEILPVLAVAIFSFRKTNLLRVQSYNAAEGVLADLTTLQVIPLIQLSLFSK